MKRLILLFIFFLFYMGNGFGQDIRLGAGISYGGPLPTETIENSTGKALPGATIGLSLSFQLNKSFSFIPGLYYSFKGLDYGQSFTRDTLISIEFNGMSAEVPSFYTAHVNGKMRLHYLDIPLLICYRFKKIEMMFGPYLAILVGGKDQGEVRVVLGTGGVFDDYLVDFVNYSAVRKIEQGLMLGSTLKLYKRLSLETKMTRSLFTLYNLDKLKGNGQEIVKMYNTYFQLGLLYQL